MLSTSYVPPETSEETQKVDFLLGMMGEDVDRMSALRVYRKHKGNVERATDAILMGDRAEDYALEDTQSTPPAYSQPLQQIGPQPLKQTPTVIDLTNSEEDDIQRAVAMSLENEPAFGPSNRPPDSNWAMVPANELGGNSGVSHEEKSYHDAIQASLEDFASTNDSDAVPMPEETVREPGRPVALRSADTSLAYAALFLQALFFVPPVRQRVAQLILPNVQQDLPKSSKEWAVWNLMEIFVNLDLAQISAIVDTDGLPSLNALQLIDHTQVADITAEFANSIAKIIENNVRDFQESDDDSAPRLFSFTHSHVELHRRMPPQIRRNLSETQVVLIEYDNEQSPYTDLMSCLSGILSSWTETGSSHDVIIEPSEVFCFHLRRTPSAGRLNPELFTYSKYIYLDQFLFTNLELANQRRSRERDLLNEILELRRTKDGLTNFNNRDTIKDLETTLYYYESVAKAENDPEREAILGRTKEKLKNILTTLSSKIEAINSKIEKLQDEVANVYQCPELQKLRYDLRAVLIHTGLPGRKQIYSYTQDSKGTWWKTVDYTVTEVPEETVFSDPTGLHLGAGPYMLIYSQYSATEESYPPWASFFTESVIKHNKIFMECLPPELAAKARVSSFTHFPSIQFMDIRRQDFSSL